MTRYATLLLISLAILIGGCGGMLYLLLSSNTEPKSEAILTPDTPARLIIPALTVDAPIEQVGRTASGNMGSPTSSTGIVWFKEGARPGEPGSAVVAGHLDNALGRSGVFKNLERLSVGDMVLVETISGETLRFRVISTAVYPYNAPPEGLFTSTDGTLLNLITCTGEWIPEAKTYDGRLVVYTEMVP